MSDDHAVDISKHIRGYIIVGVALLVLTFVTVAAAWLDMGVYASIALALFIASIKGTLVACFFMHLMSEKKLIYSVLVLTVLFFFVLLLVPTLTSVTDQVKTG